jgi:hypothetical protein
MGHPLDMESIEGGWPGQSCLSSGDSLWTISRSNFLTGPPAFSSKRQETSVSSWLLLIMTVPGFSHELLHCLRY